jgi:regulatory protein
MSEESLSREASNKALRYLSYRPRSKQEVRDKLLKEGYSPGLVTAVLARLESINYINDANFARQWIESRLRSKPCGRWLLQQELSAKGIDSALTETLLSAVLDRDQELELARDALRKKIPGLAGTVPDQSKPKLGQFLQRRGFAYPIIRQVLSETLGDGE